MKFIRLMDFARGSVGRTVQKSVIALSAARDGWMERVSEREGSLVQ